MVRPTNLGDGGVLTTGQVSSGTVTGDDIDWDTSPIVPVLALDDLADVDAAAPSDGDVIVWDDYLGAWVAQAPAGGALALDDLTDVNAPTPADGDVLTWDSGTSAWVAQAAPGASGGDTVGQFIVGWDGGGAAISAGKQQDVVAPFTGTITSWTLLADVSGSAVVDIWLDTYANFPPTNADSITAAAPPTLSGATKATSSSLTGWTTAVTAGDVLRFNLDSASTIEKLLLVVDYSRP